MFLAFSALNFYMDRYVLQLIILAAIITGFSLRSVLSNSYVVVIAGLLMCAISLTHLESKSFNYDSDMGYRKQVMLMQQAIDFAADVSGGTKGVFADFPADSLP